MLLLLACAETESGKTPDTRRIAMVQEIADRNIKRFGLLEEGAER